MLAEQKTNIIPLQQIESKMLELPQADCPVIHKFGPGIYIREVRLPAGSLALGHSQRFEHLNNMISGVVIMFDDNGNPTELKAPITFVGAPGRKLGYIVEDVVWQNIYATEETDIDTLESTYLDKSEGWESVFNDIDEIEKAIREIDRNDFQSLIAETGFTAEQIREQSENEDDQIRISKDEMPKLTIRDSNIQGKGVFATSPATKGENLGPARLNGKRTQIGRYVNHSKYPTAEYRADEKGNIYLISLIDIVGCTGGNQGEEITVDYRQALSVNNSTPEADV